MTHAVVGTAGHIDHGKSSLVLALTGTDPDRLQEEKRRGITIDLGFAHTVEAGVVLSFVDVPGHERFVRNMAAGVGGFDLVMLHVAADESVMPQTREHFEICRLLGVPSGIVVITKSDLVDADVLDVVRLEIQELVAGSFLESAPVLPVSARTGAGLARLRQTLAMMAAQGRRRSSSGPPRLPIDRVFSLRGFGTVVTGTLLSGAVAADRPDGPGPRGGRPDDALVLLPSGREMKVRGLHVHGAPCERAVAGQRVAVNLSGIEVADVARGDTLAGRDAVTMTTRADVRLELLPSARPLRHGARVRWHQGTSELSARVSLEGGALDMHPGTWSYARIHFPTPVALVRGDRFIIRAPAPLGTIGGGTVLDPPPGRRGVRNLDARRHFERLDPSCEPAVVVSYLVNQAGARGMPCTQLGSRLGIPWDCHGAVLQQLESCVPIDGTLMASALIAAAEDRLITAVRSHHASHPLEEGMGREELRARVMADAPAAVYAHVLDSLCNRNMVVARDRVALREHSLALTSDETRARDEILRILRGAALAPPTISELAARSALPRELVDKMVALLVRQRMLVRAGDLVFHESALRELKEGVQSLKRDGVAEMMDVSAFKERYGVSRKYAIPLLEFLDRERVTRRVGEKRLIL